MNALSMSKSLQKLFKLDHNPYQPLLPFTRTISMTCSTFSRGRFNTWPFHHTYTCPAAITILLKALTLANGAISSWSQSQKFRKQTPNQKAPEGGCGHRRQHVRFRCRKFKSPVTLTLDRVKVTWIYTERVELVARPTM